MTMTVCNVKQYSCAFDLYTKRLSNEQLRVKREVLNMAYYVYIIKFEDKKQSPIKIGMASNVEKRLKELQTGSPYPLSIMSKFECDSKLYAYNLERFLHKHFFKSRLCGEWFASKNLNLKQAMAAWEGRYEIKSKKEKRRLSSKR